MYVNYGPISGTAYLISYVVDSMERIRYTGYYKDGIYTIYPRQVVVPGKYPADMFKSRRLSIHEVKRGY